mmetsp:Transcript_45180/g.175336  ORF Transcript_45180/g.175336 Transcript_45180/m.175336 type:complete len:399 (-) Transcript_45180:2080-3276(-)
MAGNVKRYWPGKAPDGASSEDESESSDSSGEKRVSGKEKLGNVSPPRRRRVVEKSKVLVEEEEEGEDEVEARRARLRARRKEREEEEEEELLSLEDEEFGDGSQAVDVRTPGDGLRKKERGEEGEESESGSSEYETDSGEESSEEESYGKPKFIRPVFVPKDGRKTVQEREKLEREELEREERKKERRNEKIKETRAVIAETVKAEIEAEGLEDEFEKGLVMPDDEDRVDDLEEQKDIWKLRELRRIKREQEEEERADADDTIRNLPAEEQSKIIKERLEQDEEARRSKTKLAFMQRYHHRGAFFMDTDEKGERTEKLYNRDVNQATEEDAVDKSILPKSMQVGFFPFPKERELFSVWLPKANVLHVYVPSQTGPKRSAAYERKIQVHAFTGSGHHSE